MSQTEAPTRVDITGAPVNGSLEHAHLDLPGPAGGDRTRDDRGHFLPRPETAKAPGGSEAGETKLLPAQAQPPAHSKNIRRVKQAKHAAQPEKASITRARKEVHQQAVETTRTIMQMLITGVKMGFALGEEAEPYPELRQRIEDPGIRIMERMHPERLEMVAKYADPLQLTTALAEWGMILLRILSERKAQEQEAEASQVVGAKPADSVRGHTPPAPPAEPALPADGSEPEPPDADPDVLPGTKVDRIITPAEIDGQMGKT